MSKFTKAIAAIMLMVAVVLTAGCMKDPDNGGNNNGGGGDGGDPTPNIPVEEGIYLGIIGFNDQLYTKEISLLNNSTMEDFKGFIDGLVPRDLTALYYADYVALQKLQAFPEPPQLTNVALVTFTDGLDNLSTDNSQVDPEGYGTKPAYRNALHEKIVNERVHGKSINAYTIGLRGNDVASSEEFSLNMNALASESNNVFEVSNMSEALQKFAEIAESLYSVTTTVSLTVKIPGGVVDDGQHIRFAFDNVTAPNNTLYIEGTYNKGANPRRLDDLSYHGFETGALSIVSVSNEGGFYYFKFENLNLSNGEPISQDIVDRIIMWKETSTGGGWDKESEFKPNNNTNIEEDKNSAVIMLVLDCTTSLGSDFATMKTAAKRFVENLLNPDGGGGGGGNNQYYTISASANPGNGGTVSGGGSYQQGQTCTLSATPASGFTFVKWTENGSQVSTNANYSFMVMGNRTLVANFNYNGGGSGEETLFAESFANGQGLFTIHNVGNIPEELSEIWYYNPSYSCMYASGFSDTYAQSYNTESWLVSPNIDLSSSNSITLQFDQAVKFAVSPQERLHVMVSTNYNGNVTQATWTELNLDQWPVGNDWVFITSMADLSSFANRSIVVAFKYTSTTSVSPAWELRNIEIKAQ